MKRVCYLQFLGEGVLRWGWRGEGGTRGSSKILRRQEACFSWKGTEEAGYRVSGFVIGKSVFFTGSGAWWLPLVVLKPGRGLIVHMCVLSHVLLFVTPWAVPTRLLCPCSFSFKNLGVGYHFLFHEIFLMQGLNPHLLHWQVASLPLSHLGSLWID